MTREEKIEERNKLLDGVVADSAVNAVWWLRSAYHTHCDQIDGLLSDLKELRKLFLKRITDVRGHLTVREAQLLNACRICRCEASPPTREKGDLILNYGEEFAHENCLILARAFKESAESMEVKTWTVGNVCDRNFGVAMLDAVVDFEKEVGEPKVRTNVDGKFFGSDEEKEDFLKRNKEAADVLKEDMERLTPALEKMVEGMVEPLKCKEEAKVEDSTWRERPPLL